MVAVPQTDLSLAQGPADEDWPLPTIVDLFRRANELYDTGEYNQAITLYDQALQICPDLASWPILNNRGLAFFKLNRLQEALSDLNHALLDNADPDGYSNRGRILAILERQSEALADFSRALSLKADHFAALKGQASVLASLGRMEESLNSIEPALEQRPDDPALQALRRIVLDAMLRRLVRRGFASWSGGKPKGSDPLIEITPGPPISDYIHEDRG